jgi:hypothetical protein
MQYVKQSLTEFESSNLVDLYDEWSPTTPYILEVGNDNLTNASIVRYGAFYYRSVTNDNVGYNPLVYENVKWVRYAVSNKFAMLDMSTNSKSVSQGEDLVVTFLQGQNYVLGLGNYEADTVLIEILASNGTTVLWSYTTPSTVNADVTDYFTYMYSPYILQQDYAIKVNLPVVGRYIRVTFNRLPLNDYASCGYLVLGNPVDMGMTLMGVSFSYNSFTTKEITDFGNLEIKKGFVQELVDFETVIDSTYLPTLKREIKKIYDEILLFIVDESASSRYENLLTLGVIQDASVVLENGVESIVSFSIMEAI